MKKKHILFFIILILNSFLNEGLKSEDVSIIMIPDTQNYINDNNFKHFKKQIEWIIKNKKNIVFVSHVGDVISNEKKNPKMKKFKIMKSKNNYFCYIYKFFNEENKNKQYLKASNLLNKLNGIDVPFSIVPGNHDYDCPGNVINQRSSDSYVKYFGKKNYKDQDWFIASDSTERNMAQKFSMDEKTFLHIGLEWLPSDSSIEFAQKIIIQNPNIPVIITTHSHLYPGVPPIYPSLPVTPKSSGNNSSEQLFKKLFDPFPQIFLVLSGHFHGNGTLQSMNLFNKPVNQILANYQDDHNGGNGWLNKLIFNNKNSKIDIKIFSPSYLPGKSVGLDRSKDQKHNGSINFDINKHQKFLNEHNIKYFRQDQFTFKNNKYKNTVDKYISNKQNSLKFFRNPLTKIYKYKAQNQYTPIFFIKNSLYKLFYFYKDFGRYLLNKEDIFVSQSSEISQGLLKFTSIIGNSKDQISSGAKIKKAFLTITSEGREINNKKVFIHQMKTRWDMQTNWKDFGNGVKIGIDSIQTPTAILDTNSQGTFSFDVTEDVQRWIDGFENNGWVFISDNKTNWSFRSSKWLSITERPMLTIIYKK